VSLRGEHLCGDGDLNLNTGLDVDDDLLDDLSWSVETVRKMVSMCLIYGRMDHPVEPFLPLHQTSYIFQRDMASLLNIYKSTSRVVFQFLRTSASVNLHTVLEDLLNQTLVDSHLKAIPSLGTFTTRSLSGGNLQGLGWETDWALDAQVLGLCAVDELLADLLEGLNVAGSECDANLVGFLFFKVSVRDIEF